MENPVGVGEGSCRLGSDISFVSVPSVRVARAGKGGPGWGGNQLLVAPRDVRLPHVPRGGGRRARDGRVGEEHVQGARTHARTHARTPGHTPPTRTRGLTATGLVPGRPPHAGHKHSRPARHSQPDTVWTRVSGHSPVQMCGHTGAGHVHTQQTGPLGPAPLEKRLGRCPAGAGPGPGHFLCPGTGLGRGAP